MQSLSSLCMMLRRRHSRNLNACAGCVFLANSAFTQACVMWVTLIPLLFKFNRYAKARYGEAVSHMYALLANHTPVRVYLYLHCVIKMTQGGSDALHAPLLVI